MTALTVATLALGAASKSNTLVTLQVAPRGPGSVSAVPTPSAGDPQPCTAHDAENECERSYDTEGWPEVLRDGDDLPAR